ncbi:MULTISPECIES: Lnb N-terminal periplasmic domain-containing protein [unclassified Psychrobacter]|uniref:Lnb N-terminal periplasmic domain-containing protein n=1 Tax=unclassified Psychrobacter TaxID=196806 RepID=UPI003FD24B8F
MSLRSVFSRLLSSRSRSRLSDSRGLESRGLESVDLKREISKNSLSDSKHPKPTWRQRLVTFLIAVTLLLSALWLLLAIWYQYGVSSVLTWLATIAIVGILAALLSTRYWDTVTKILHSDSLSNKKSISKGTATKLLIGVYGAVWLVGLGWFFSIEPKQNREWMAEVDQRVSYERDATNPDLITLTNVRNFDWQTEEDAIEHWDTRTIDLSKLSGVDVTNSYWMGPLIAHTLVSFRFEDDRPLAFSFEIRKEDGESFSALAGFFRRYELSLIAAEERDIIYTRSNARGEQVYLFPISNLQQHEVRSLFESYLTAADDLNAKPAWYNTLLSNCTNIIFYMARIVSGDRLPWDYRIWVSGWLPNYLYDVGMLDAAPEKDNQPWSMNTWYERTHINPKAKGFENQVNSHSDIDRDKNSRKFSQQIRQDIPIPALANSQASAEAKAKSTAQASN